MERLGIPIPSVVLAIILGPMIEFNFITSLIKSDLNPVVFVSRPIAIGLAILTISTWTLPFIKVGRIKKCLTLYELLLKSLIFGGLNKLNSIIIARV